MQRGAQLSLGELNLQLAFWPVPGKNSVFQQRLQASCCHHGGQSRLRPTIHCSDLLVF